MVAPIYLFSQFKMGRMTGENRNNVNQHECQRFICRLEPVVRIPENDRTPEQLRMTNLDQGDGNKHQTGFSLSN